MLSPALGYAVARAEGRLLHGGAATLDLDYGLTDSFGLRASGRYEGLARAEEEGVALVSRTGLGLGALYVFDAFHLVPYAAVTVGALGQGGVGAPWRWNAEGRVAVGMDWIAGRTFSTGLEVAYSLVLPDFRRFPWAITVSWRLSYRRP